MIWSSGSAERVGLVALLGLLGCAPDAEIVETQVLVIADTERCDEAEVAGERLNLFLAQLHVLEGEPAGPTPCSECFRDGTCPPVARRCSCGGSFPPDTIGINAGLRAIRFADLDADAFYCVQVAAFDVGADVPAVPQPCACPEGLMPLVRMCGGSPIGGRLGPSEPAIVVGADCGRACRGLSP